MTPLPRYLLDTDIWIYIMRNRPEQVRRRFARLGPSQVLLSPVVLGVLNVGWRTSERADSNRQALAQFTQGALMEPVGVAAASAYGEIRAELERLGTPIGQNDLWIAAQALAADCVLVTHDVDEFKRVPGLKFEDWANIEPC